MVSGSRTWCRFKQRGSPCNKGGPMQVPLSPSCLASSLGRWIWEDSHSDPPSAAHKPCGLGKTCYPGPQAPSLRNGERGPWQPPLGGLQGQKPYSVGRCEETLVKEEGRKLPRPLGLRPSVRAGDTEGPPLGSTEGY